MMTNKKKLKRKNKRLKKEFDQLWADREDMLSDSVGLVLMYHDVIRLFCEYDEPLFLRSIRAADLKRIKALKERLRKEKKETEDWMRIADHNRLRCNELQAEIEKLKAPQVQMYLDGEPMEVVGSDDDK